MKSKTFFDFCYKLNSTIVYISTAETISPLINQSIDKILIGNYFDG